MKKHISIILIVMVSFACSNNFSPIEKEEETGKFEFQNMEKVNINDSYATASCSGYAVTSLNNPTFINEGDSFNNWFYFLNVDQQVQPWLTGQPQGSYVHFSQLWHDEWESNVVFPSAVNEGPYDLSFELGCFTYQHRTVVRDVNAPPLGTVYYPQIADIEEPNIVETADFDCESYTCKIDYSIFFGMLVGTGKRSSGKDTVTIKIVDRNNGYVYYEKTYSETQAEYENEMILNFNIKNLRIEVEAEELNSSILYTRISVTEGV